MWKKYTCDLCSENNKSWFQSLIFSLLEAELPFNICPYTFYMMKLENTFQEKLWSRERCQIVQSKENCIANLSEHLTELSESFLPRAGNDLFMSVMTKILASDCAT